MTCLHGFLGLPSDWDVIPCTAGAHKVDWMPVLAGLPGDLGDPALPALAEALNAQVPGDVLLGYSMGGRIAMHMLLAKGGARWRHAVIVSASPGLPPALRTERLALDHTWAERFRNDPWVDVTKLWNDQGVFAKDGPSPLARNEADFRRDHLALALTRGSVADQEDLREALAGLQTPICWIAGERDTKYAAAARECVTLNPRFRCEILRDAGHRAPWTAPRNFCAMLEGLAI